MDRPTILLVDDEDNVRVTLQQILELEGYAVTALSSAREAVARLGDATAAPFDLVLADLRLADPSDGDGMAVVAAARRRDPEAVAMVLTGYASLDAAIRALRAGAYDFIIKPSDVDELKAAVARGIERRRLAAQMRRAATLIEASRVFAASGPELADVLDAVVRQVVHAIGDAASLLLLSPDGEWLDTPAFYHPDPERLAFRREMARDVRLRVGEGLVGRVAQSGEPFFTNDPAEIARLAASGPRLARLVARYPIYGVACAPLRTSAGVIGVLSATHDTPGRPYTEQDVALLQELADRAALAVQNARLLEEARAAQARAEEAVRQRDTFISVAGHELRTPLTSLRGYAQIARRELSRTDAVVDPRRADAAWERVERQTRRIERLVSRLLDLTSVQSGRLTLDPRVWELRALLDTVVDEAQLKSADHQVVVRGLEEVGSLNVWVDRARVEQVLVNVLDNAIKYSPDGGTVELRAALVGAPATSVRFSVRDRGVGIPADRLPHVFEPYYRAHRDGGAATAKGMGLGLYVCREIVKLHGGTIDITCPPDGGTRVDITLPLGTGPVSPG